MIRGTTPINKFTTDTDLSNADKIYITYKQNGKTKVEKTKEDITFGEGFLQVKLSQEETLGFSERSVDIQIRAKFLDGTAIASNIINTSVSKILKEGEI